MRMRGMDVDAVARNACRGCDRRERLREELVAQLEVVNGVDECRAFAVRHRHAFGAERVEHPICRTGSEVADERNA